MDDLATRGTGVDDLCSNNMLAGHAAAAVTPLLAGSSLAGLGFDP